MLLKTSFLCNSKKYASGPDKDELGGMTHCGKLLFCVKIKQDLKSETYGVHLVPDDFERTSFTIFFPRESFGINKKIGKKSG